MTGTFLSFAVILNKSKTSLKLNNLVFGFNLITKTKLTPGSLLISKFEMRLKERFISPF